MEPTDRQKDAIFRRSGLFTVRACPGSGKTYTVAARLNRLLHEWHMLHCGIAALSFTNVAWKQISAYLVDKCNLRGGVSYPHFLGTIDSFINTYIFLPFGHLVLGCSGRPKLTGPPHDDHEPINSWLWWGKDNAICNQKGCKLNDLTHDSSGRLVHLREKNRGDACAHTPSPPCKSRKLIFHRRGYATQSDANYFALRLLKEYPVLVKAIVARFPVLMIDEAQDTSSVQMAVLDTLIDGGLQEVMLVGDPDQAIYEWREAEPRLFVQKCEAWADNSLELEENWRSTQAVCVFANYLSSTKNGMHAVNPDLSCHCDTGVEIWNYSKEDELPTLLRQFTERCKVEGIDPKGAAVLTRGQELLNSITPGAAAQYGVYPWKDTVTRGLAQGKSLFDHGSFRDAFKMVERALVMHISGKSPFESKHRQGIIDEKGLTEWRASIFELLSCLPTTGCLLGDWVRQTHPVLEVTPHFKELTLNIKQNSKKCRYSDLNFQDVFSCQEPDGQSEHCYYGTVHSVKGRSLDAVFLVLKRKAGTGATYVNLLDKNISENEELRILYVGMTRACRLLILVVPAQDARRWREHFHLEEAKSFRS
ncbi:MAG: UvrD-helicase domain-containing protein [Desulfomonilaceae bacterium]